MVALKAGGLMKDVVHSTARGNPKRKAQSNMYIIMNSALGEGCGKGPEKEGKMKGSKT